MMVVAGASWHGRTAPHPCAGPAPPVVRSAVMQLTSSRRHVRSHPRFAAGCCVVPCGLPPASTQSACAQQRTMHALGSPAAMHPSISISSRKAHTYWGPRRLRCSSKRPWAPCSVQHVALAAAGGGWHAPVRQSIEVHSDDNLLAGCRVWHPQPEEAAGAACEVDIHHLRAPNMRAGVNKAAQACVRVQQSQQNMASV